MWGNRAGGVWGPQQTAPRRGPQDPRRAVRRRGDPAAGRPPTPPAAARTVANGRAVPFNGVRPPPARPRPRPVPTPRLPPPTAAPDDDGPHDDGPDVTDADRPPAAGGDPAANGASANGAAGDRAAGGTP